MKTQDAKPPAQPPRQLACPLCDRTDKLYVVAVEFDAACDCGEIPCCAPLQDRTYTPPVDPCNPKRADRSCRNPRLRCMTKRCGWEGDLEELLDMAASDERLHGKDCGAPVHVLGEWVTPHGAEPEALGVVDLAELAKPTMLLYPVHCEAMLPVSDYSPTAEPRYTGYVVDANPEDPLAPFLREATKDEELARHWPGSSTETSSTRQNAWRA